MNTEMRIDEEEAKRLLRILNIFKKKLEDVEKSKTKKDLEEDLYFRHEFMKINKLIIILEHYKDVDIEEYEEMLMYERVLLSLLERENLHRCPYCGEYTSDNQEPNDTLIITQDEWKTEDILCKDCQEAFGHFIIQDL